MTDVRKNLVFLISILIGMIVVLLFLNLSGFRRSSQKGQISNTVLSDSGYLPVRLSKSEVNFFDIARSGDKVIFYEENDSIVYEASLDGKTKKEFVRIPGVREMIFSPDHSQIIAAISESGKSEKYHFNLFENKRTALDSKIKTFAFSPNGSRIAYHLYDDDSGEGNISVARPDGSDSAVIFKTRIKDLELAWPEENMIIFSDFAVKPDGSGFKKLNAGETGAPKKLSTPENLGIEASAAKMNLLGNYAVYLNAKDGKFYSLKVR